MDCHIRRRTEVERPIDDTEDYGDKFEEDLSDKLPEEEPEDDE